MPLIPIELIRSPADPVRQTAASQRADEALRASIAALGMLQPVLLAQRGNDGYTVIAGRRRLEAARALGLAQIPAHVDGNFPDSHAIAAGAAENMVRAAMEPLDQWRAIVSLHEGGYTLAAASAALGLSERHARRLDKLGRLHPDILAQIARFGMPDEQDLGVIATAPLDKQALAIKSALAKLDPDAPDDAINWWEIARACTATRIPQALAIFDVGASGITFEEDLFAEPEDPDAIFTTDVAAFVAAQQAALKQQVADTKKLKLAIWSKKGDIALPKGWVETLGDPAKPKKTETVFAAVALSGYHIGRVVHALAKPDAKTAKADKAAKAAKDVAADDTGDNSATEGATPDAPARELDVEPADDGRAITAAGRDMIARAKTAALRDHLLGMVEQLDPSSILAYLVLALGVRHVSVTDPNSTFRRIHFGSYAEELVPPEGVANLYRAAAKRLAVEALADILVVPDSHHGAEPACEWIGQHCNADVALPRFDTPEFLATVSGAELKRVAAAAGLKPAKSVAGLRAQLAGALPDWRPPGAEFGAPGPTPGRP